MSVKPVPDGYHTVTPYLAVPSVEKLVDFMIKAFAAQPIGNLMRPDGSVMHAEVRIGDSVVMMGEPRNASQQMLGMIHLYIPDVDAAYQRALGAGATSVEDVSDEEVVKRAKMALG